MKKFFLFLLIFVISSCNSQLEMDKDMEEEIPSNLVINYDASLLIKGKSILFQTGEYKNAEYEWSYKALNEDDYILVDNAVTNKIILVFVETGNYNLKVEINGEVEKIIDLEISDAEYDSALYTKLLFEKQADDSYALSLRFSDEVLNIIRNQTNTITFFDIALRDYSSQPLMYLAYSYNWDDNLQEYVISTGINTLENVAGPDIPDQINISELTSGLSKSKIRKSKSIDNMICQKKDIDPITISFEAKPGYLVITENISDFSIYY